MDSARNTITGETVSGIDVWKWEPQDINPYTYECLSCGQPVYLASYKKDVNKKAPYFKTYEGRGHKNSCPIETQKRTIQLAKECSVSTPDGFPLPYPSKLVLKVSRPNIAPDSPATKPFSPPRTRKRGDSEAASRPPHNFTVNTIRPLAIQFMDFPWDRHLKLSVPLVAGNSFREIFRYLSSKTIDYPEPKIFFGPLSLYEPDVFEEYIEVALYRGRFNNGKLEEAYRVRIHTHQWTNLESETILDEIEVARNKYRELLRNKTVGNRKPWLFFLGEQDSENPFIFHVKHSALICCLTKEFIWGNFPFHSKPKQNGG